MLVARGRCHDADALIACCPGTGGIDFRASTSGAKTTTCHRSLIAPQALPSSQALPIPQPAPVPRFLVLIDAAHGGAESGARLSDRLLEKDLTLALSVRLRSILSAHGIAIATTRESDTNPSPDSRAAVANRTHAAACLVLHATASGSGTHLYTSSIPAAASAAHTGGLPSPPAPRSWTNAQAPFVTQSLRLSSDVSEALSHAGLPVTLGSIAMQPLDTMGCPAVLIELAPLLVRRGKDGAALGDSLTRRAFSTQLAALWSSGVPTGRHSHEALSSPAWHRRPGGHEKQKEA